MIENRLHQLLLILYWINLFVYVIGGFPSNHRTTNLAEKSKALKITNTDEADQEIILENIPYSAVDTLKFLTWLDGKIDDTDLKLLNELKDLKILAFIRTTGNINLTGNILGNLTELKELVIHHNDRVVLEEGSLGNLKNLQVLSADNQTFGSITSHTFENCTKLQYLSLTNGFLGEIESKAFQNLRNLNSITLSKMSLRYLRKNTFNDLPLLYMINLSGNQLSNILGVEFSNLPKLSILNLEKNFLHSLNVDEILKNLPLLNILEISHNKFSCKEILKMHTILMKFNISSVEQREIQRCRYSPSRVQILSAK